MSLKGLHIKKKLFDDFKEYLDKVCLVCGKNNIKLLTTGIGPQYVEVSHLECEKVKNSPLYKKLEEK